jgi:hypothetical protein
MALLTLALLIAAADRVVGRLAGQMGLEELVGIR